MGPKIPLAATTLSNSIGIKPVTRSGLTELAANEFFTINVIQLVAVLFRKTGFAVLVVAVFVLLDDVAEFHLSITFYFRAEVAYCGCTGLV